MVACGRKLGKTLAGRVYRFNQIYFPPNILNIRSPQGIGFPGPTVYKIFFSFGGAGGEGQQLLRFFFFFFFFFFW